MDRLATVGVDWTMAMDPSGRQLPEDSSWAPDESQASITIHVPTFANNALIEPFAGDRQGWNIHKAIAHILGYTRYVGTNQKFDRWVPCRHPLFPHLRATKVTRCVGIGEQRRLINSPLGIIQGAIVPIQVPLTWELTILFQSLPYECLENTDISTERDRYVTTLINPTAEIITRQGGTYKFVDGTPPGIQGTDFPQPIGLIYGTYDLVQIWHQVPAEAVFNGMYPTRIQSLIGKVNAGDVVLDLAKIGSRVPASGTFSSTYTAGQLLLTGAQITPEMSPVVPQMMGLSVRNIPRTYRVEYRIKVDPNSHNKKPWSVDDVFYAVSIDGLAASKKIYAEADFGLLFQPL